ncbi:hypothetical protein ISN34_07935 [Xanthomonas translucens pv. translucens]|uniref:hypothetical protein n=1 Tax=Xanthomonas campestris pv. translucens TaxID=343 RepID=UPI0019D6E9DF|nr:hypothetical protein [Xanthomonas translucens]QSQ46751.1 hypothetical protein ISN34_07935 [Xanthomonas translucens pv. translucens]
MHEIVVTGERFIGTRGEKRGGGGAIDLTLYLHGWESSKFKMAVGRLLEALRVHGFATQAATGEWVISDPEFSRSD